jgi:hypothetical protein
VAAPRIRHIAILSRYTVVRRDTRTDTDVDTSPLWC